MEHEEMDVDRWVDDRLASLEPSAEWKPDSTAALARLRRREQPRHGRWWLWASLSFAAAVICIGFLLLSAPSACANPLGCKQQSQPAPVAPAPAVAVPAAAPAAAPAHPKPTARKLNFKESGSPSAPLTCELYTDFECPHCATFYLETLPQLTTEYVKTGKVRLIHRDFPLAQHHYAALAARYANAAGELGYYQTAATRLFRMQPVWTGDGDIDLALAPALPPAVMAKVREMVNTPDESLAADVAMARADHLNQTPTIVLVYGGNRLVIGGGISYADLKAKIDQLLAGQ